MKRLLILQIAVVVFFWAVSIVSTQAENPRPSRRQAIHDVGKYASPGDHCTAVLKRSEKGGFFSLELESASASLTPIDDVTGIAWTAENDLVFTVSPLYGTPGIYVYRCKSRRVARIMASTHVDKAYPLGADYFELQAISNALPHVIYFYYAPDVDRADFKDLRAQGHLYRIGIDGRHFEKAP